MYIPIDEVYFGVTIEHHFVVDANVYDYFLLYGEDCINDL